MLEQHLVAFPISSCFWVLQRIVLAGASCCRARGQTYLGVPSSSSERPFHVLANYNLSATFDKPTRLFYSQRKRFLAIILLLVYQLQSWPVLLEEVLEVEHLPWIIGSECWAS